MTSPTEILGRYENSVEPPDAGSYEQGDAFEDPRDKAKPRVKVKVEKFDAVDLLAENIPPIRWAVEGFIPDGLSVLAGKPKLGKSWMALQFALAIAQGGEALGVKVDAGNVLYLALEDNKRRLQSRIVKLLVENKLDRDRLTLIRVCPRQHIGGALAVVQHLEERTDCRLVVIDTWGRFRPPKQRGADSYQEDTDHAAEMKGIADKFGVPILAVAHCRKAESSDPVEMVSGTLGLTGVCDGILVLARERGQHDATLFVTGRDIDEREIALRWDPAWTTWTALGQADEYRLSREKAEIMEQMRLRKGQWIKPIDLTAVVEKSKDAIRKIMGRLEIDGWLKSNGKGQWTVSDDSLS